MHLWKEKDRVTKAAMAMKERKGIAMEVEELESRGCCDARVCCCESMAVEQNFCVC